MPRVKARHLGLLQSVLLLFLCQHISSGKNFFFFVMPRFFLNNTNANKKGVKVFFFLHFFMVINNSHDILVEQFVCWLVRVYLKINH